MALAGAAIVLAFTLRAALHAMYLSSDVTAPGVIAEGLPRDGAVHIAVGLNAYYTTLWFNLLTRDLPLHRQLWVLAPVVSAFGAVALLAWSVHRLAGRFAALATAAAAFSMAPAVLFYAMSQGEHGPTYVNIALLGATLTWLGTTRHGPRWRVAVLAPVATLTGLDMTSDSLLLLAGLAPFVLAPALAWVRGRADEAGQVALASLNCALAAIAVDLVGSLVARAQGFQATVDSGGLNPTRLSENAGLLARVIRGMGGGNPIPGDPLAFGIAVLGVTILGTGVFAVLAAALTTTIRSRDQRDAPLAVHRYFWAGVVAALILGFLFTDFAIDGSAVRYLVPVQYAVAATVPVLASGRQVRGLVAVAVSLLSLSTSRALAAGTPGAFADSTGVRTAGLTALLLAHGLHHGYAGYWQANAVSWASDEQVQSRSVAQGSTCGSSDPGMLCRYDLNTVLEWYIPVPGRRTFFIRDPQQATLAPNPPSATLGTPVEVLTYDRYTIYVYADDIAARFR